MDTVLSACLSLPYILFLQDVEPRHIELILSYMYRGEINVEESGQFQHFKLSNVRSDPGFRIKDPESDPGYFMVPAK